MEPVILDSADLPIDLPEADTTESDTATVAPVAVVLEEPTEVPVVPPKVRIGDLVVIDYDNVAESLGLTLDDLRGSRHGQSARARFLQRVVKLISTQLESL